MSKIRVTEWIWEIVVVVGIVWLAARPHLIEQKPQLDVSSTAAIKKFR